jgi:hypothetical protein
VWDSFERFLADMGEKPKGMTIERIKNDRSYGPGNCRWATPREQAQNRRSNRYLTINGERMTVASWAEKLGMSRQALRYRLEQGWRPEELLLPIHPGNGWRRGVRKSSRNPSRKRRES